MAAKPKPVAGKWTRETLPRVVIAVGPESVRREEAIASVRRAAFGGTADGNWIVMHGPQSQNEGEALVPATVLDELCTTSMFASADEMKIVLVRTADLFLSSWFRVLESGLEKIPDTSTVVFDVSIPGKLKSTTFYKNVAAAGGVIECGAISSEFNQGPFEQEISERARSKGLRLTHGALVALINRSSKSVAVVDEELDKLALAVRAQPGGEVQISENEIAAISSTTSTATAFNFVDAVVDGDTKRSLEVLGVLFERGLADSKKPGKVVTQEDAITIMVLAALTWRLSQLQDVRAGLDAGKTEKQVFDEMKLSYGQEGVRRALRRHDSASLRRAMDGLFQCYLDMRRGGGGVDPRTILERFVFAMTKRN